MGSGEGGELRTVLSKRNTVLASLRDSAKTIPTLVDELAFSRSTIDRAIEELMGVGCLEHEDRRYRASAVGRAALQSYRAYLETSDGIQAASPVLEALAPEDPIDQSMLRNAEVYRADPQTPEIGLQRSIELAEEATRFRGYASVFFEEFIDVQLAQLQREEYHTEIIIEKTLHEQLQTHFEDKFSRLTDYDRVRIILSDRMITYSPWEVVQDTNHYAGMTVYDEGAIKGVIVNDSPAAVNFIRSVLNDLAESGSQLSRDDAPSVIDSRRDGSGYQ